MPKSLRLPLMALSFAVILLVIALVVRFAEDDDTPVTPEPVSTQQTLAANTPSPDGTPGIDGTGPTVDNETPIPTPTLQPVAPVSDVPPPVPGHLREALVGEIRKLNPLFIDYNPVDRDITSLIFEGLTTINEYGEVLPQLAERWEVSRDGLTYVFALRRDVLWQDGTPFTSADVKYTIDVMRDPAFPGDAALTAFWRTMEMTVIDEYTLRFRLVQPLASFPESLRFGVLPAHALEGYPVSHLDRHLFNLAPIGTGPYQVESLLSAPGQGRIIGVVLRVAPTYRQRPEGQEGYSIDRITFRTYPSVDQAIGAFARGEVDSISSIPPENLISVRGLRNLSVHTSIYPAVGVLIYNWQRDAISYMQDQRARIAFARGIDRRGAVERNMQGVALPADSPLVPFSWAYDPQSVQYPAYDVPLAQSMLENVSFENPTPDAGATEEPQPEATAEATEAPTAVPEVVRKSFRILVLNEPYIVALAEDIAAQWGQLGFTVTVEAEDEARYIERLQSHDFDTAIVEYSFAPYADPDAFPFWHIGQYPDGLNYGGMRDIQVSEVLLKARRETVGLNRVELYRQFQELFTQRASALTLYYPLYSYLIDNRLEGVQLGFISTPADRFRTIKDWHWQISNEL